MMFKKNWIALPLLFLFACDFIPTLPDDGDEDENQDKSKTVNTPKTIQNSKATLDTAELKSFNSGQQIAVTLKTEEDFEVPVKIQQSSADSGGNDYMVVERGNVQTFFERQNDITISQQVIGFKDVPSNFFYKKGARPDSTEKWIAYKQVEDGVESFFRGDIENRIVLTLIHTDNNTITIELETVGEPKFIIEDVNDTLALAIRNLATEGNYWLESESYVVEGDKYIIKGENNDIELSNINIDNQVLTLTASDNDSSFDITFELVNGAGEQIEGNIWQGIVGEDTVTVYFGENGDLLSFGEKKDGDSQNHGGDGGAQCPPENPNCCTGPNCGCQGVGCPVGEDPHIKTWEDHPWHDSLTESHFSNDTMVSFLKNQLDNEGLSLRIMGYFINSERITVFDSADTMYYEYPILTDTSMYVSKVIRGEHSEILFDIQAGAGDTLEGTVWKAAYFNKNQYMYLNDQDTLRGIAFLNSNFDPQSKSGRKLSEEIWNDFVKEIRDIAIQSRLEFKLDDYDHQDDTLFIDKPSGMMKLTVLPLVNWQQSFIDQSSGDTLRYMHHSGDLNGKDSSKAAFDLGLLNRQVDSNNVEFIYYNGDKLLFTAFGVNKEYHIERPYVDNNKLAQYSDNPLAVRLQEYGREVKVEVSTEGYNIVNDTLAMEMGGRITKLVNYTLDTNGLTGLHVYEGGDSTLSYSIFEGTSDSLGSAIWNGYDGDRPLKMLFLDSGNLFTVSEDPNHDPDPGGGHNNNGDGRFDPYLNDTNVANLLNMSNSKQTQFHLGDYTLANDTLLIVRNEFGPRYGFTEINPSLDKLTWRYVNEEGGVGDTLTWSPYDNNPDSLLIGKTWMGMLNQQMTYIYLNDSGKSFITQDPFVPIDPGPTIDSFLGDSLVAYLDSIAKENGNDVSLSSYQRDSNQFQITTGVVQGLITEIVLDSNGFSGKQENGENFTHELVLGTNDSIFGAIWKDSLMNGVWYLYFTDTVQFSLYLPGSPQNNNIFEPHVSDPMVAHLEDIFNGEPVWNRIISGYSIDEDSNYNVELELPYFFVNASRNGDTLTVTQVQNQTDSTSQTMIKLAGDKPLFVGNVWDLTIDSIHYNFYPDSLNQLFFIRKNPN